MLLRYHKEKSEDPRLTADAVSRAGKTEDPRLTDVSRAGSTQHLK